MNSTPMPWACAQRAYMRSSMFAQSLDSVPPAPALISMKQSLPSASPDSSASSSARAGQVLQERQLVRGVVQRGLVALGVGQLGELDRVGELALQLLHPADLVGQARALAHQRLGRVGVVPEGRVLDPRVQLIQVAERGSPVKDAS